MLLLAGALSVATTFERPGQADVRSRMFGDGAVLPFHHDLDRSEFRFAESVDEIGVGVRVRGRGRAREVSGVGPRTGGGSLLSGLFRGFEERVPTAGKAAQRIGVEGGHKGVDTLEIRHGWGRSTWG